MLRFDADDCRRELLGSAIGPFVLDDVLGVGGQAAVFLGHRPPLDRKLALKVFGLSGNPGDLNTALEEARKQSAVQHQCVVQVFDPELAEVLFLGETRRVLCIPMEYSESGSCAEISPFQLRPLVEEDLKALIGLLDGLQEIHKHGIVHNDLKPDNILRFIARVDGSERSILKITDFGIAKVVSAIVAGPSGMTLPYMAPEQADHTYSEQGDIYSMGATLFTLLTGQRPITPREDNLIGWATAHREEPRPNIRTLSMGCPPRLALLLMRMMSVNASERPSLDDCQEEVRETIAWQRGQLIEVRMPAELLGVLRRDQFPLRYTARFRDVITPVVHQDCGQQLLVARMQMPHPILGQYKRLIEYLAKRLGDTFSLYETWGLYDVNLFAWAEPSALRHLDQDVLHSEFPGIVVQAGCATKVRHLHHQDPKAPRKIDMTHVLALQEGRDDTVAHIAKREDVICGRFPTNVPERSVRAFTYVETARRALEGVVRGAIVSHVVDRVREMVQDAAESTDDLNWLRRAIVVELDRTFEPVMLLVDYVVSEYRYLERVPTKIIELGDTAVKTSTSLETRRVVMQSDRMLL